MKDKKFNDVKKFTDKEKAEAIAVLVDGEVVEYE